MFQAPYFICGVAVVLTACLYLFLHSQKLLDQLDDENKEMAEPRPEESLNTVDTVSQKTLFKLRSVTWRLLCECFPFLLWPSKC